jgi:hypothetical protein
MAKTGKITIAGGRKVTAIQLCGAPEGVKWFAVFGTPASGPEFTGPVTFYQIPADSDAFKPDAD